MTSPERETGPSTEDAVAECLERLERGESREALQSFLGSRPDAEEVLRRISRLSELGLFGGDEIATQTEQFGDFECGERIGGGGMGIVYRGRQKSVDREVAIKMLYAELAGSKTARERFQRETALLARLDHPSIVRVIGAGEVDERPYLAMELVRGATLHEVIRAVRDRVSARLTGEDLGAVIERLTGGACDEGGRELCAGSWIDAVLKILRQTALALSYAHDQGVLHRDVKPSNVMVTATGRVSVLDFGLSVSLDADFARVTKTGTTPGSPAYMAPEQGRGGELDPRTDVYGLGVTMYELLALELPFLAESEHELRERIAHGEVVPLTHRNRAVSKDVATVCAKAMERDPARRYATAQEFADDLERLLRREPVAARPPGPWRHVRRWIGRRPATATALLSALLLLGGVPTLLWVQEQTAAERIAEQWRRAEEGEARAQANLETALQAVDRFLRRFGIEDLSIQPLMARAAREAVADAVDLYEEMRQRGLDDPRLALDHVRALRNLAFLLGYTGEYDRSIEVVREAGLIAVAAPPSSEMALERVFLLRREALSQMELERSEEAATALDKAGALVSDTSSELAISAWELDRHVAGLHSDRAKLENHRGRLGQAVRAVTLAIERLEPHEQAGEPLVLVDLATALGYRAFLRKHSEGVASIVPELERSLALLERLPEEVAARPRVRLVLANVLGLRAKTFHSGDVERGLNFQQRAVTLLEELRRDFSDNREVRLSLSTQCEVMADMLWRVGQYAEAQEHVATAIDLLRQLSTEPEPLESQSRLVEALMLRGSLCRRAGDREGAEKALEDAGKLVEIIGDIPPGSIDRQVARLDFLRERAKSLGNRGQGPDAVAVLEQAVDVADQAREFAPDNLRVAKWQGVLRADLVDLLTEATDRATVMKLLQTARGHYRWCLDREPDDTWTLNNLAKLEVEVAWREWNDGAQEQALQRFEEAMGLSRRTLELAPTPAYRQTWMQTCMGWLKRSSSLGRWQQVADVVCAPPPDFAASLPMGAACLQASALAWLEVMAPEEPRQRLRGTLRAATLASLRRLLDSGQEFSGWREVEALTRLADDPEFGPLLERLDDH